MKQNFFNYISETFRFSQEEMKDFMRAISQPLKKTIRINTQKISPQDFKELKTYASGTGNSQLSDDESWVFNNTSLGGNMLYIDRNNTSIPLGHTLEHISGYFYVQELAASSSPYYLSEDKIDTGLYNILDMSASPGGKTTQLAEYYPNSIIIANEIDKTRLKQLYENTDRLGAKNVFVTNYDGRYFGNYSEIFDKIILDAPCSGEGVTYKVDTAVKYWNIKNIKRIAKLQFQLLDAALIALKSGGEIVYSTCTLNRLENEEIIEKVIEKYKKYIKISHLSGLGYNKSQYIRSWPHKTGAGGFFVAKIQKIKSFPKDEFDFRKSKKKLQKHVQGFCKLSSTDQKEITKFLQETFMIELPGKFYSYRNEIYYTDKNIDYFWENFFFYKCGIKIGKFENTCFIPNYYLGVHFGIFKKNTLDVSEEIIGNLLKGIHQNYNIADGYYQIMHKKILAGIVKVKNNSMQTLLETKFMRK